MGKPNKKNSKQAMTGRDLDVPGAGLDDQQESLGSDKES